MVNIIQKYIFKNYLALRFHRLKLPLSPYSILRELEISQYWDRDLMRDYQLGKLNKLIDEARSNTKFYRNELNGVKLEISNLENFSKIFPKTSKNQIIENLPLLRNTNILNLFDHSTSGSTGQPMTVQICGLAEAYRLASKMRFYSWWNVDFHDKSVLIWKLNGDQNGGNIYTSKFKRKLKNRLDLDIFNLNDQTVKDYVKQIDDFAPTYIRSYKSGLFELARLMDKYGLRFRNTSIKLAVVTSEVLLQEERDFIKSVFDCHVANEYGSAEGGFYAGECEHGSMHINEELSYIYTDKDNNAIVTELNNLGTPLINYRNDDKIYISDEYCTCGRTSRIIEEVEGRVSDFIICPDGSKKSSFILSYIIREAMNGKYKGSIKQFRVIQDRNNFILEMVPGMDYNQNVEEQIKNRMRSEIGQEIKIEVHLIQKITREESGKQRYFKRIN